MVEGRRYLERGSGQLLRMVLQAYIIEYLTTEKWNNAICSNMDATRDYHKGSKSQRERQILIPYITYMRNSKYDTNEHIGSSDCKASACRQETWVWSLDREDPLEKEIVSHSSTLAWKIPWMEEPGRLQSIGLQRLGTTEWLHWFTGERSRLRHREQTMVTKGEG